MMKLPLHFGYTLGAALITAIVLGSDWIDAHRYFDQQMPDPAVFAAHSADATFAGRELRDLPPTTRVVMDQRLIGQPTIQFLAPEASRPEGYAPMLLPLTVATDTALFLNGDETADAALIHRLYPSAVIKTFSPPQGGPVLLQEARITASEVAAIQGLHATFRSPDTPAPFEIQLASPDIPWDQLPFGPPLDAAFDGALNAPASGDYILGVDGPKTFRLSIDRQPVAANGSAVHVMLARGNHHFELTATFDDPSQPLRLLWQPPTAARVSQVPSANLFATSDVESGLLGAYYPNGSWSGPPAFQQIDPFVAMYFQVTPLPLPFSIEWTGQLAIPLAGSYALNATSTDSSQIFVDDAAVRTGTPLTLSAGWHPIRVRYEAHSGFSHIELRWQPPGQEWQIVRSEFLAPSAGLGSVQPLPALPPGALPATEHNVVPSTGGVLTTIWQYQPGSGGQPVGVATDQAGNAYVIDAGRKEVVKLDPDGRVLWTSQAPPGAPGFEQLAAVATAPDGGALVLDAESGVISRFQSDGEYAGVFAQNLTVYHPRGLAVGPNGDTYVADTGGSRVLHLNANGTELDQIGGHDSATGLDQPTGVAVTADGNVVVVDPVAKKVIQFASSGGAIATWAFGGGPTLNGPQVAVDAANTIWVSDTDSGSLEALSTDGSTMVRYQPDNGLSGPSGLASGKGYVLVAEPGAGRVRKFVLPR